MSPLSRSKQLLESEGYLCDVVERRLTSMITKDLFGFIDLLALKDGETLAIQATSDSNVAARRKKALASEHFARVLAAGWKFEVWGWAALKSGRYRLRRVPVESKAAMALEVEAYEAKEAKKRMERGRPTREAEASLPQDTGRAREKAASATGASARNVQDEVRG